MAVETGGAGARHLGDYQKLGTLIEAIVGGVRRHVAVVAFDSAPGVVQDFTSDLNAVGESLRGLEAGDRRAAILDGLSFSVDLLRRQPPTYRRVILLIGETVDQGSHTTLDEALHAVSDTNTAIYSLGFSSSKAAAAKEAGQIFQSQTPGPAGGCMAQDPDNPGQNKLGQAYDCLSLLAPPLRLPKIAALAAANGLRRNTSESVAQLTGGEFFRFSDAKSLERDLLAVSHHLPNRYVLSFHPVAPHAGFHAIALRLRDYPDLVVEARNSYWVDGDTGPAPAP